MEKREDLLSILEFLPLKLQTQSSSTTSSLAWPSQVIIALESLSKGPTHSKVDSGEILFLAISDLRQSLSLSSRSLSTFAADGFALFFDEFLSRAEAAKWFGEVLPVMADLLLRLPALLESHYQYADIILVGVETGLRLLEPQQSGIVFLSQELIAALLSCSFFCLFPTSNRGANHLPTINFDHLFAILYESYHENHENKIKCIWHYFERVCSCMPSGYVSFERKVLSLEHNPALVSCPTTKIWANSIVSLCQLEVSTSGLIEDQSRTALEVDFANKYLGGGALRRGCVQEEIRFMINPELIAGMLFMSSMSDNEAIEIVGAERFSNYTGYGASFRYSGDHVDEREVDLLGRRKTRIIAIDALCSPGWRQYELQFLLREVNKAFCGFLDLQKYQQYQISLQCNELADLHFENGAEGPINISETQSELIEGPMISPETEIREQLVIESQGKESESLENHSGVGIVTGNWGCGAFGGDPEVKAVIQWLAASQALRPFVVYYTFGVRQLQYLKQVSHWVLSHKWTVGDLWNMLCDYCWQRADGETELGFFLWLVPSLQD